MGTEGNGEGAARGATKPPQARLLNINVGVLGHVDSGKTSLVRALSTQLSTAALDKHPQSKERGITLDLGFSSFMVPLPERLQHLPYDQLQFTLVDCPGHASLIRTILGGAQIIDMMVLVVDVTKGIQAQTAECIVVGELTTDYLIVALNKIDQLPVATRDKQIHKAKKRLRSTFGATKFPDCPILPVSAKGFHDSDEAGGSEGKGADGDIALHPVGLEALIAELAQRVQEPAPPLPGFLFAVDHCFPIKGQGTVLTGTVISGSIKVNDTLELPELKLQRKVKSMQMFKRPVQTILRGDRAGVCVTKLDSKLMERGLASNPSAVPTFSMAIAAVEKIRFFAGQVKSKSKFNITIGHTAALAELTFFGLPPTTNPAVWTLEEVMTMARQHLMVLTLKDSKAPDFNVTGEYLYQDELYGFEGRPAEAGGPSATPSSSEANDGMEPPPHHGPQWALIKFDRPVTVSSDSLLIGARFDMDSSNAECRLALYGRMLSVVSSPTDSNTERIPKVKDLKSVKVFKPKQKTGVIERVDASRTTALCKNLLKKETDISPFLGLKVIAAGGEEGVIESSFGKSGKFNVRFNEPLKPSTGQPDTSIITLNFKRYVFDEDSKRSMKQ